MIAGDLFGEAPQFGAKCGAFPKCGLKIRVSWARLGDVNVETPQRDVLTELHSIDRDGQRRFRRKHVECSLGNRKSVVVGQLKPFAHRSTP